MEGRKLAALIGGGVVLLAAMAAGGYWLGRSGVAEDRPVADAQAPSGQTPAVGRWELQAQYEGPLKDTVVQRWRDPANGVICYLYLPIIVQHSPPLDNGMVQYGANGTGTISCVQPRS